MSNIFFGDVDDIPRDWLEESKLLLSCAVKLMNVTTDGRPYPVVTRTTIAHQPIVDVRTEEAFKAYWAALGVEVWRGYQGR